MSTVGMPIYSSPLALRNQRSYHMTINFFMLVSLIWMENYTEKYCFCHASRWYAEWTSYRMEWLSHASIFSIWIIKWTPFVFTRTYSMRKKQRDGFKFTISHEILLKLFIVIVMHNFSVSIPMCMHKKRPTWTWKPDRHSKLYMQYSLWWRKMFFVAMFRDVKYDFGRLFLRLKTFLQMFH